MKKRVEIKNYYAFFEPAEKGAFNVSFPDFPGCVTFGKNFEHAKLMAQEVLELWIQELQDQKQLIPKKLSRPIIDEISVFVTAR